MSTLPTLLGTTAQDVTLFNIAWHSNPRCQPSDITWHHNLKCHPFWHCSAQQPEMSTFLALFGIIAQNAIFHDIAREQRPKMYIFIALLGTTTQDAIINDIAREQRIEMPISLWHCLASQPKMSFFTTLLEGNDLRCRMFAILLGRIDLRYRLYIVFLFEDSFGFV